MSCCIIQDVGDAIMYIIPGGGEVAGGYIGKTKNVDSTYISFIDCFHSLFKLCINVRN